MDAFQVDELKLYLGDEIKIADGIVLKCPLIHDIANFGESLYFSMAQTLCATPSSMKVTLNDMKLDWMQVDDFELFMMLCQSMKPENTYLLLGDLDLSSLKPYSFGEDGEVVLSNEDHTIIINKVVYDILVTYIRKMHGFKKQIDKAGNAITKKVLIDLARQDAKMAEKKPYKSFLLPLVSSLQGRQGYTKEYIGNMGIFEFMNQIARTQIIVQADAALSGAYSGMVDTKKMDKSIFDWMRDITEESDSKNKTVLNEGAN
jgi:hypothetical protein